MRLPKILDATKRGVPTATNPGNVALNPEEFIALKTHLAIMNGHLLAESDSAAAS